MEVLALIPARGGSKSIPHKNIYPLLGKPLIAYTIEAVLGSKLISRVIVSTDDEKIARIAKKYGAEVPFMRPRKHAGDRTPDLPVFKHAIQWLAENENYHPDVVVHLWPTSPLRYAEHIDQAVKLLADHPKADAVRSVSMPSVTPFKMWIVDGKNKPMRPLLENVFAETYRRFPEPYAMPRQALPAVFAQDGYIQVFWRRTLEKHGSMFGKKVLPFFVPAGHYTEFDGLKDLKHAEYMLKLHGKHKARGGKN